jgi:hypothetical protein
MNASKSTFLQDSIGNLGGYLPPRIVHALNAAARAIQDFVLRVHLTKWRLISTAPSNQELELRIVEDGNISALEFPCLRTNAGAWINVDLGAEIKLQAVEWRVWQHRKAPQPYHSQIKLGSRPAMLRHARNIQAYKLRPNWSDAI